MLLDFLNLIKKYNLNINGIIHIGAHHGQEYALYEKQNIKNILFFEPLKNNFNKLQENLIYKDVILVNKALGSDNKKIVMNVETSNNSQSCSILKPKIHLQQYPNIVFDKTEEVEMITLDSYFTDNNIKKYNFINIDVQGYELEVFKGSKDTLNFIDYIICEVNRAELYENCANIYELDQYLNSYRFKRVETSWNGITWGDAFYVKSS